MKVLTAATANGVGLWLEGHGADGIIAQGVEAGTLVLIRRGDVQAVGNNGDTPLPTLNVYVRLAYPEGGEEPPPGEA